MLKRIISLLNMCKYGKYRENSFGDSVELLEALANLTDSCGVDAAREMISENGKEVFICRTKR